MSRPRRSIVLAVLLSAVLALPLVGLTTPAQAKGDVSPDFRVMTLNIKVTLPSGAWAADAQRATTMTDILSLQEAEQQPDRDALEAMLHGQGWDMWYPAVGGGGNPVAWNASKFYFVSGSTVKVLSRERGVTPDRWINMVVLGQVGTDRQVTIVNTHTINRGAVDAGLKPNSRTPKLKKHLRMLRTAIQQAAAGSQNVIATGDLNVNYMRDRHLKLPGLPTDVLGPIVDFDMPIGRTYDHGNTELDYLMTLKDGGLAPVSGQIVPGFRSDHRGVVVGLIFLNQGPSPVPPPDGARFSPGTMVNHPHNRQQRRAVPRMVKQVLNAAPAGSAVHLATGNLSDGVVYRALLRAHRRGVYVQVLLTDKHLNNRERSLRSVLHHQMSGRTWFSKCLTAMCRRTTAQMAPTTLLVSQSGATRALRLTSDRYVDSYAVHRRTHAWVTTDLDSYNASFHDFFLAIS